MGSSMPYTKHIQKQPPTMSLSTEYIVSSLQNLYGQDVTSSNIREWCESIGVGYQTVTKKLEDYKVGRGKWNLTIQEKLERVYETSAVEKSLVPHKDENFVPFGNFTDIKKIVKSNLFYPAFITGLSGNGKTFLVEQACAQLGRELIRVNITIETDEDDLLGGFRLVDGNTSWHDGPVIEAMRRGAILLLDEVDLASNKIMCLQSLLEGNGVFLKKIGEMVRPARGFNVIATANTKGKGSDDGRFIGTNVLNEAFLERFCATFEQSYPTPTSEKKLLLLHAASCGVHDEHFVNHLCDWGDVIRKTFYDGGIDEVISTRRLVHIIRAYSIFGNKKKAIEVCTARFDDETKQAFIELYDKFDADFDVSNDDEKTTEDVVKF